MKHMKAGDGRETTSFVLLQLSQVWAELQLLLSRDRTAKRTMARRILGKDSALSIASHDANMSSLSEGVAHFQPPPWHCQINRGRLQDVSSSFTHRDVSSVLSTMGIAHENERVLENSYVVDIFIPGSGGRREREIGKEEEGEGEGRGDVLSRGTVIEYDGPSHFESYLRVSFYHYNNTAFHIFYLYIFYY
jgi:hypothetical protein